ncbi:helix-turn-helix transcriptional regulator [Variovorax sp. RB2P76]|uniref:helix-turn-helix transcriptional regulator n=1 Tax=Variovorax sp. RB2P76 TaxID=3443736 RepID=UPI003F44FB13
MDAPFAFAAALSLRLLRQSPVAFSVCSGEGTCRNPLLRKKSSGEVMSMVAGDPMSCSLSERLHELIAEKGRGCQADLARHCGVTRPAITHWLSGRNKGVESIYLFAIADYFRVDTRWLATGKGTQWTGPSMDLSKQVHPTVGEVLTLFEEKGFGRSKTSHAERIELYLWLVGDRIQYPGPDPSQTLGKNDQC